MKGKIGEDGAGLIEAGGEDEKKDGTTDGEY